MLFNSFEFLIFFPIVFILYWILNKKALKWQNLLILIASYFFYSCWDWRFVFLLAFSTLLDFYTGNKIFKAQRIGSKKIWLWISVVVNLGFLGFFKYYNFFIDSFANLLTNFGLTPHYPTLNIILPVGISFYTFHGLSYVIDIYYNRFKPTRNFVDYALFVSFFPLLVAGPIERAKHLLPQIQSKRKFDYDLFVEGITQMIWGFFKKVVIADRVAAVVNQVYSSPGEYGNYNLAIATVFFAIQIYCDFSGYSDIAIGAGKTMGFRLLKNFNMPYFSKSLNEFWKKWHISLTSWFRDYFYIPMGGNRKGEIRTYFNIFIVFVVSGLWHGAAFTFIIWGAIHGLMLMIERYLKPYLRFGKVKNDPLFGLASVIFTFTIVCVGWVFFRADSLADSIEILKGMVNFQSNNKSFFELGLSKDEFKLSIVLIIFLFLTEYIHKNYNLFSVIRGMNYGFKYAVYLFILFVILIFGIYGGDSVSEFIYFQF